LPICLVFPGAGQDGKALFMADSSAVASVLVFFLRLCGRYLHLLLRKISQIQRKLFLGRQSFMNLAFLFSFLLRITLLMYHLLYFECWGGGGRFVSVYFGLIFFNSRRLKS
jgi:hypothetical protein